MPSSLLSKLNRQSWAAPTMPPSARPGGAGPRRRALRAPRRPSRPARPPAWRATRQSCSWSRCLPDCWRSRQSRSCAGLLVTQVIEPAWGIGAADERVNVWLAAHRTPARTHASLIGSIIAGGVVLPIVVGVIALRLRHPAQVADRGLRRLRARRRVGHLPAHDARHPRAPAPRRPARGPARQRQLPVRSHGGVDRRLRRARAAAHLEVSRARASRVAGLDGRRRDGRLRRDVADVSRHAPSARRRGRSADRDRRRCSSSCSRAARPARPHESRHGARDDR